MNDEEPEQASPTEPAEDFPRCGPGCDCGGATRMGTRGKLVFFLVVAVAATAVLVYGALRQTGPVAVQGEKAPAGQVDPSAQAASIPKAAPNSWGAPLDSLQALNDVASDQDAVFIYVPDKKQEQDGEITRQIDLAASRTRAGGLKTAVFMLDVDSSDYLRVAHKASVPCVLALVKGRGMEVVSSDITEGSLTRAMMTAWSASGGGCCSR